MIIDPASRDLEIQNPGRYAGLAIRDLRAWLTGLLTELAPSATSFGLRLTSDREIRRLNREYRQRDRPTDVLSFPGDLAMPRGWAPDPAAGHATPMPTVDDGEQHLGDVVISVPTARRQATAAGHSVHRELRLLALHGVLHCLGYDHERDDGTMERREQKLRHRWLRQEAAND